MGKDMCFLCCYILSATSLHVCCCTRVTVLRVETGAPFGIFDIYSNSTLSGHFNWKYHGIENSQYKSEIINDWNQSNIQQVTINIYRGMERTAFFMFDGNGTDSMNWMSKSRLIRTSYTDLDESTADYVQISLQDNYVIRRFYISAMHGGCSGDTGWLVLIESRRRDRCAVDNVSSTTIWYSDLKTKKKFDDFQKADYMTIEVEMEITCDIKDLHVDNTTYNTTGYMYNDTVTYQCVEGFQHASGDLTRRCIGINTWSGRSPVCLECQCKCKASVYIHPNDTKAIEASVRKLKSELSIKVNETSKAQRRKTSATDDRASAKVVGSVLGGTLLASLVLLIVVSDASALLNNMRMACHNVKSRTQFRGKK